jgi:hypothetical protein
MNRLLMPSIQAHKIASGTKTLHLHPAHHNQDMVYRPCPYRLHSRRPDAIAVINDAKPGQDPIVYIELSTRPVLRTLAQVIGMGEDTLLALGHERLFDHQHAWVSRYDTRADLNDAAAIVARYMNKWAQQPVWVLRLRPIPEPRLLTAKPPSETAEEGDYTDDPTKAMRGEGEAVPANDQKQMTTRVRAAEDGKRGGRDKVRSQRNLERFERRKAA